MSGLIGFTKRSYNNDDMLIHMRKTIKTYFWHKEDIIFSDAYVCSSRTYNDIIDQGNQPYIKNNQFFSWMDGEWYNQAEIKKKYNLDALNDNELMLNLFVKSNLFDFLRYIDGCYSAVIYDKFNKKIFLITDRYGLKPLYWGLFNNSFIWSSEIKGFLNHKDFSVEIDPISIEQFFNIGYHLENRTWFKGIELVPPGSVLTFDIQNINVNMNSYWSWDDINTLQDTKDHNEIAEELGRLLKEAVKKRIDRNHKIGITLSGGLDSRAILASVPKFYKPLHTFTFGQKGCHELQIAERVAKTKGTVQHSLILKGDNWLINRISGIWKSDGAFSLLHMHGIEFLDKFKECVDFNLNGMWGDVIGGLYIKIAPLVPESYTARNRGRRFINQALVLNDSAVIQRRPFCDNDLIEFAFSLPPRLRSNSYIYKKMLLKTFPQYFRHIPWEETGYPISYSDKILKMAAYKKRVLNKLLREGNRLGIGLKNLHYFTDYASWLRRNPTKIYFNKILFNNKTIYPDYIDSTIVRSYFNNHMNNKNNYHNELCAFFTFEIWLQQIFNNKYRNCINFIDSINV